VKQYLVEAWADPHDGRTRRHYIMAASPDRARERFAEMFPERVIRNMWQGVPTEVPAPRERGNDA
jgi:hypothetical protein